MIRAVSFHAIERLQERRGCVHLLRHLHKLQKWDMPTTGIHYHKGFKYVMEDGVLVTVYPDNKAIKEYKRQQKGDDNAD